MERPYRCWYVDWESSPEDGGLFIDVQEAETADEALTLASDLLDLLVGYRFTRARLLSSSLPVTRLNHMHPIDFSDAIEWHPMPPERELSAK